MRAGRFKISLELLLNMMGLDNPEYYHLVSTFSEKDDVISIAIESEQGVDSDLSIVKPGEDIPEITIICEKIRSHIEIIDRG